MQTPVPMPQETRSSALASILSLGSWVASMCFFAGGAIAANLMYRL